MFGIGGGEFIFIIFVILMFFGSDKIPEMARTLGKGIAQLKNATNDIKSEIRTTAKENGLDTNALTGGISEEISKAKEGFSRMVHESAEQTGINAEIAQIQSNFKNAAQSANGIEPQSPAIDPVNPEVEGPIKRQS